MANLQKKWEYQQNQLFERLTMRKQKMGMANKNTYLEVLVIHKDKTNYRGNPTNKLFEGLTINKTK